MSLKNLKNPRYEKSRYGEDSFLSDENVVSYGEKKGTRTKLMVKRGDRNAMQKKVVRKQKNNSEDESR